MPRNTYSYEYIMFTNKVKCSSILVGKEKKGDANQVLINARVGRDTLRGMFLLI